MKKLIISSLALLSICSVVSFSQLKYDSNNNLGIGITTPSSKLNVHGSAQNLEISNTTENESGILFHDHGYELNQFANIMFNCQYNYLKFYVNNSTQPTLSLEPLLKTRVYTNGINQSTYNDNGLIFDNSGYGDMSTLRPYTSWAGNLGTSTYEWATIYVDHLHYSQMTQVPCDINMKENIRDVTDPLDRIKSVRGVQYDLKEENYTGANENLKQDLLKNKKDMYGFIAQELKEVFPELVTYDEEVNQYGVNMIGFIPILLEAIKDQQSEIDNLKEQISPAIKSASLLSTQSVDDPMNPATLPTLSQNVPNPFDEITKITYSIPEINSYAMINVYDLNGSQVKSYNIPNTGLGEIEIPASELQPGLFIYNLVVDGYEVTSRRMVLTE